MEAKRISLLILALIVLTGCNKKPEKEALVSTAATPSAMVPIPVKTEVVLDVGSLTALTEKEVNKKFGKPFKRVEEESGIEYARYPYVSPDNYVRASYKHEGFEYIDVYFDIGSKKILSCLFHFGVYPFNKDLPTVEEALGRLNIDPGPGASLGRTYPYADNFVTPNSNLAAFEVSYGHDNSKPGFPRVKEVGSIVVWFRQ